MYATRTDIESLYGADWLAGLLPDDVPADEAIARAISVEASTVDGYLSARYRLPLAAAPESLKVATIDLACWRLAVSHDRLTEEIANRAETARRFLKDIAAGKAGLGAQEPVVAQPGADAASGTGASFHARPRRGYGEA